MTFLATGLFVDGFAGGGGASTGIAQAIGNSVCPPVARALVAANQPGVAELRRAA